MIDALVKTTFTVLLDGKANVDAFCIGGDWIEVGHMHHVQKALEYIKQRAADDMSRKRNYDLHVDDYTKHLEYLHTHRSKKDVEEYVNKHWLHAYGKRFTSKRTAIKYCEDELKHAQHMSDSYKMTMLDKFKAANKNKGYDAAEFLVISGYAIALEAGHIVYSSMHRLPDYFCREFDVECDYSSDDHCWVVNKMTKEALEERRQSDIAKLSQSYWATATDLFHCPSGCLRMGYLQWEQQCRDLGISPGSLRRRY